jgi:serine/threonine-protein kinase
MVRGHGSSRTVAVNASKARRKASASVQPGTVLGRYRVLEEIGSGGFGRVYAAEPVSGGARVAVKTLSCLLADAAGQESLRRFIREVEAARRVRHPNVVKLHGGGTVQLDAGTLLAWYAMELVEGQDLYEMVCAEGPMDPSRAVHVVRQAAAGLRLSHAHGIIHRDIKPENIMVAAKDRAVVMDFGICKERGGSSVTAQGALVGTARYMAPEQLLGRDAGPAADTFALSAVLFFLLAGEHVRPEADLASLNRVTTQWADLWSVEQATLVPVGLKPVLMAGLQPDPAKRLPSMDALMAALDHAARQAWRSGWIYPSGATVAASHAFPPVPEPAPVPAVVGVLLGDGPAPEPTPVPPGDDVDSTLVLDGPGLPRGSWADETEPTGAVLRRSPVTGDGDLPAPEARVGGHDSWLHEDVTRPVERPAGLGRPAPVGRKPRR